MRPTLFEFAGKMPAMLALAAAHHARCLADPELNHPFSHGGLNPQHVERLAAYWAEVLGGPATYSQCYSDQSAMLQMHAGNGDMTDLAERFVTCFVHAADDAGLPDDREFRAALRAYMEWAVGPVNAYPAHDATVPLALAMPRWSWDGLQVAYDAAFDLSSPTARPPDDPAWT
jgi:hemoglobin